MMGVLGFQQHGFALWTDTHRVKYTAWGSWQSPSAPYIYCPFEVILIQYKERWKKDVKGEATNHANAIDNRYNDTITYATLPNQAVGGGENVNYTFDLPDDISGDIVAFTTVSISSAGSFGNKISIYEI